MKRPLAFACGLVLCACELGSQGLNPQPEDPGLSGNENTNVTGAADVPRNDTPGVSEDELGQPAGTGPAGVVSPVVPSSPAAPPPNAMGPSGPGGEPGPSPAATSTPGSAGASAVDPDDQVSADDNLDDDSAEPEPATETGMDFDAGPLGYNAASTDAGANPTPADGGVDAGFEMPEGAQ